MYLLSANGTLRTILLLLILWLLLRMWMRMRAPSGPGRSSEPRRPQGDVRIERPDDQRRRDPSTPVEDADFEELP